MKKTDQEIEVKFYINNLAALERRLSDLGAVLVRPRTRELNLRFDTQSGKLRRRKQVLRLRQDQAAHLTFKGKSQVVDGVFSREEIEFEVGDFEAAKRLIEALGFQVVVIYEKFRAIYTFKGLEIALDELPFGYFVEIEGPDRPQIRAGAEKLDLVWETAIERSYLGSFEELKRQSGLSFRDLTFENFSGITVTAEDLGVRPADSN